MTETKRNPPLDTLRDGAMAAKLWKAVDKEGRAFVSVTLGRTYTDEAGAYKESRSFSGPDILKGHALLLRAHALAGKWQERFRDQERQDQTQSSLPLPEDEPRGLSAQRDRVMASKAARETDTVNPSRQRGPDL